MVIFFTGTGSSEYVANAIADRLDDCVISSNEIIKAGEKRSLVSEKPWVFVFPVYLSTMPAIFMDFIRRCSFEGSKKAYFVACCASASGSSSNRCADICREKRFEYCGISTVRMPQNYIALFTMTEPEEIKKRISDSHVSADEISRIIQNGSKLDMSLTSKAEYIMVKVVEKLYNGPFTQTKKFIVSEDCIGCGMCAKQCPMNKIDLDDNGRPRWSGSCIHCMSCINRCPKHAIEYGSKTAGKTRYVSPKYHSEKNN